MAHGGARVFAAGFRALGVEAETTSPSDERTRELGGRYTTGEECYPAKVTVGDFMKVLERPGNDPAATVFFMPTADGPCRFGQYAYHLRHVLDSNGFKDVGVLSPSSKNSYGDLGNLARPFVRTSWRMLVVSDILQKLLLQHRPYERTPGATDKVYEECLDDVCATVEGTTTIPAPQMRVLKQVLLRCRERFASIDLRHDDARPLIGVIGEIFCRLNTYANDDSVKRLEEAGAEVWLAGVTEWLWYTVSETYRKLKLVGRQYSMDTVGTWVREKVQHRDEHQLMEPFHHDFSGYEEPEIDDVLDAAMPYLPVGGALGEMVLNVGRTVCLAKQGVDGIIDISPFTCMNGIVCEAVYPSLSKDLNGLPIRTLYFDGTPQDLEANLPVYMDLARSYQRKKGVARPMSAPQRRNGSR
jgi:predicted nucleotide-binding protein (sugar kinase/HSP70/actin superfamily)